MSATSESWRAVSCTGGGRSNSTRSAGSSGRTSAAPNRAIAPAGSSPCGRPSPGQDLPTTLRWPRPCHRLGIAGQQPSLSGDHQRPVRQDPQLTVAGPIPSGRTPGKTRHVADQDTAFRRLGMHECLDHRRWKVMAVGDQAGGQSVLGQLIPNVIGEDRQDEVGTIAQVRAHRGAGVHGGSKYAESPRCARSPRLRR